MLAEIDEDLGELQHIVDDVLTAARLDPEARRGGPLVPLRRSPTRIPELVDPPVARLCTAHPAVKVELELPEDLPEVEVDALLVRRVIGNVLENARRYGPADGPIVVRGSAVAGRVHLEIEDRGIGIAPADLAKVFVPFFRAETSRSRDKGGIGLGLTLAKRIVDAHGGSIAIRSTLGEGTTVAIDLPAAA
jgi:signal transduction histidine kinase